MGIRDWFAKDEVIGSRVLVCGLGPGFDKSVQIDSQVYSRFYRATTAVALLSIRELSDALDQRYDIVHLLCDVPLGGMITDADGNKMACAELIERCCNANVKLLWMASDNQPDSYIRNCGARGKRLNLVMTIVRNDPKFSDFLEKLLFRMFYGDTMPVAWEDLAPQIPGSAQLDSPGCIFFAGRGGVRLR
jgi:hypothetical protein